MKPRSNRVVVAVIGSASSNLPVEAALAAEAAGRAVVDCGCVLVTGGMSGVMEAACRGGRSSPKCDRGSVVGILPGYDHSEANEFVQIAIPTGMQLARNTLVAATADAVVAVGGGSGTLSEIALAWQLGKPIVAVGGVSGWGDRLIGEALDHRAKTPIASAATGKEAVALALQLARADSRPPGDIGSGWRGRQR